MRNYLVRFTYYNGGITYLTVYARNLDHAEDLASEIEKVTAGVLINQYDIDELE